MPKVTPVAIHGDLSDNSELAPEFETEDETAVAVAEPVELIDFTALESFIASYGPNRLASSQAWIAATGIDGSALHNALRDRVLSLVSRPSAADNHRREFGLMASDFLAWAKKNNIPYALTQVARTAMTATPAEAVETRSLWNLGTAVNDLGVDAGALRGAIQKGELRGASDPNLCASISRIEPGSLLRWITSRGEPIRLSLEYAGFLTRTRRQARAVEQGGSNIADAKPPSLLDEAEAIAERISAAEREEHETGRRAMLADYAAILRRRETPQDQDANNLAHLTHELGFTRARVEEDIRVLETVAALDQLATTVDSLKKEQAEKLNFVQQLKDLEKRARQAQAEVFQLTGQIGRAERAPLEAAALRERRPELFDQ